jgi:hypothetical protein
LEGRRAAVDQGWVDSEVGRWVLPEEAENVEEVEEWRGRVRKKRPTPGCRGEEETEGVT